MKPLRITRFLLLIPMATFCVWMLNSCQVVELVISGTTYYETEITTKDNQLIAGQIGGQRSSNLPSGAKTSGGIMHYCRHYRDVSLSLYQDLQFLHHVFLH